MKNGQTGFSKAQQAFNSSLMNAVPGLLDTIMQYFVNQNGPLKEFMKELPFVFWKDCWYHYFKYYWGEILDFSFMNKKELQRGYDYVLVVPGFVSLNSLYTKMKNKGIVKLDEDLYKNLDLKEEYILPGLFFSHERRIEGNYVLLHKDMTSKSYTSSVASNILDVHEKLCNETMNLLEVLLWQDFVDTMRSSYLRNSFFPTAQEKREITRCVATLLNKGYQTNPYYASVVHGAVNKICASPYFGGTNSDDNGRWDYVRKIKVI